MRFPKDSEQAFLSLVEKAHDNEGPYLSPHTRIELENIAMSIGFSWDEKSGYDYGNETNEEY